MMRECLIHVHFAYWQKEKDECWKENQGKCTAAAKYNDDRMSSQPAHAPDPVSGAGWLAASWLALNTGFFANASLTSPRFLFLLHLTSLCHQLSHFSTNAKPSMPKWIWPFEQLVLVLVCLSPKPRFAFQSWPCRLLFSATGTSGASHRWNYQTKSFAHFDLCQMYFLTQNLMRWMDVNHAFLKPNKNLGPDRWWLFVQGIRLLLAHTETEFEDKQLSCGPGWCNNSRASNIYLFMWC